MQMPTLPSRRTIGTLLAATLPWMMQPTTETSQSPSLEFVSKLDGPAEMVVTDGHYAYLSAGRELRVVDISDRARPTIRGVLALPDRIYGWHVEDQYAYLALGLQGLHIVDVSEPTSPTLLGVHETAGQALGVSTNGTTAMVVNLMSGLEVVDISERTAPALVATQDTPGYQWGISSIGSRVFVVDQPSGIHLFDLSTPTAPILQGMHPTPSPATSVATIGELAYVVYGRTGSIEVLDFSDPATPVSIASFRPSGRPRRVVAEGSRLYIPLGSSGVEVVDVSDPSMPLPVAAYDTPGNALDVAIHDDLVAVADETGLVLLRQQ